MSRLDLEPPLNSTPSLKPRKMKLRTQMRTSSPDAAYQRNRLPMKSIRVSPRYSRWRK